MKVLITIFCTVAFFCINAQSSEYVYSKERDLLGPCRFIEIENELYAYSPNRMLNAESVKNQIGPVLVTSTRDESNNHLKTLFSIFPNPCSNIINLSFPYAISHFQINNELGEEIDSGRLLQSSIKVDHLPAGLYMLQCYTDDGQMVSRKFIKH